MTGWCAKSLVRAAFLLACLSLPGTVAAQDRVMDRLSRADQLLGWQAVGRVDVTGAGFCTGTLVASDLVLTAAHCLFDRAGQPVDPGRVIFRAGFADGQSVAESRVARSVVHSGFTPTAGGHISGAQILYDVALLQLAQPISTALAAPFAVESPGRGDAVSVVSYARGREEALSWQRACNVLGRQEGLIAVDCNVTFGSSGAPVFDLSRGRAKIVSLISGGGRYDGRDIALGMELPKLMTDLTAQLRAGRGVTTAQTSGEADLAPQAKANSVPGVRRLTVGAGDRPEGARFLRPPQP